MQASILPKRADHEAQKLGFLPLTSVAAFCEQRSAGCGVAGRYSAARAAAGRFGNDRAAAGRYPAERHVSGRHSSTGSVIGRLSDAHGVIGQLSDAHGVIGRLSDIPGPQNVHLSPDNESRVQISPGASGFRPAAPGRPTRHRPTLRPAFCAAHLRRHPTSSAKIAKYNPRICVM